MKLSRQIVFILKEINLRCNNCNRRSFHGSPLALKNSYPDVTRQKKIKERLQSTNASNNRNYTFEETLPPLNLLKVAYESGALSIEPERALQFLRQYYNLASRPSVGWERKLCTEFGIEPSTVTLLAAILRRCKTKAQQSSARALMLSASAMGDTSATFEIVSTALRSNVIKYYQGTLNRLHLIAKDGNQKAMMLFGKVLFHEHSEAKSLCWLEKATQPPSGSLEFDGAGEALVLKGRILKKYGDSIGAKAAFEKAAKDLNDPEAYFYLSQMEENGSFNQESYLLKAATTGIIEAWYNLGVLELDKIQKSNLQPKKPEDYGMAREWFLVAAHGGNGPSMLNLAIIYKLTLNLPQALDWLNKAQLVPSTSIEAMRLKKEWNFSTETT